MIARPRSPCSSCSAPMQAPAPCDSLRCSTQLICLSYRGDIISDQRRVVIQGRRVTEAQTNDKIDLSNGAAGQRPVSQTCVAPHSTRCHTGGSGQSVLAIRYSLVNWSNRDLMRALSSLSRVGLASFRMVLHSSIARPFHGSAYVAPPVLDSRRASCTYLLSRNE